MQQPSLLFVYGTLKQGYLNHGHLADAGFLGVHETVHPHPLVILAPWEMPSLYDRPGSGHRVRGELYAVDQSILERTDVLEMVDDEDGYERREILVRTSDHHQAHRLVWTYFKRGSSPELEHGPWLQEYREPLYRTS